MSIKRIFVLAVICLSFAIGCGSEATKKSATKAAAGAQSTDKAMPQGHPNVAGAGQAPGRDELAAKHQASKVAKEIKLSSDIKKQWSAAKLELKDIASAKSETVTLKVGTKRAVGTRSIVIAAVIPDYSMFEDHIGTKSADPNNPAVYVELFEGGKSVTKGWVFRDFTDFNSFKSDKVGVVLLDPIKSGK